MAPALVQQINHVSHVCFIVRKENLQLFKDQLTRAFNVTDWDGPLEVTPMGLLQTGSISTGLEIIAPLDDQDEDNVFTQHIQAKGEGLFSVIYGVKDVELAAKEAQERGTELMNGPDGKPLTIDSMTGMNGQPVHAAWNERLKVYREIALKPMFGINFWLGQIEPLRSGSTTSEQ
ncbi:hypothetical protein H2204_000368 [Knufia peltigerae]|uniref:Uncharacterized protein n=1 Tax=Knufia peltigerae TaxID=1002370 RepID=A0AA38YEJ6_9EURO|nr:hypothetical protein H2204_000368 [Knufia peltigerae]